MTKTLSLVLTLFLSLTIITIKAQDASDKVFDKVEKEAEFTGGQNAWVKFLTKTLRPNVPIDKGAPAGTYTVIVRFIVSKNGTVTDIEAETKFGYGMEAELKRVIALSPEWKPAMQNGKPLNAYRLQPITFIVPEEKKKGRKKN